MISLSHPYLQVSVLSAVILIAAGIVATDMSLSPDSLKEERKACMKEAVETRNASVHEIIDLFKSEMRRFKGNQPAQNAARDNKKNDLRAAKEAFKSDKEDCKSL